MPLANSRNAIGAVGQILQAQLAARTSTANVTIGRVEAAAATDGPKLNLFLYQIDVEGHLRNTPLDAGQKPPVWLVLRYLMTAFDLERDSDSANAHSLLGEGVLALEEMNYQRPTAVQLTDNPEPLKISLDNGNVELLSRVMQGTDERYRLSAAFQIRPIMIAPEAPPDYAPLVHSVGPPQAEGVTVMPSMGPVLEALSPTAFDAGDTVTLLGSGLDSATQFVCLDDTPFPVTAAPNGTVQAMIPADTTLSPGSYAVSAARERPSGRIFASNALTVALRPTLQSAAPVLPLTDEGGGLFSGDLTLTGVRLGGPDDAIFVAFWRDGAVILMLEATGIATQDSLTVTVQPDQALDAGIYTVLLRANGAQALATPQVDWS
ncbi:Protein of unknown function [Poseidonocella pacifica]|uniref:Pvc16 N-terminal domain-containing protein n=1 Tax=Poseidonocella pacifica TaxID=871651 RepID=A0A1I0VQX8_9RHOB|nr:DUF4255 domain-containing protein [Poseidonocella pacifica]SFA78393.1 Protein of unknown function [Poseidonocella pacifica]